MPEIRLARLKAALPIVNPDGTPTVNFVTDWQRHCEQIEANDAANDALDQTQSDALDILDETVVKANACYAVLGPGAYAISTSQTLPEDCRTAIVDTTAGVVTLTLNPVASSLSDIVVKKINAGANNVVVDGNGAETIDGAATLSWNTQYQSYTLRPALGAWHVI